jgi:undecaprenyl-diphosphatase
LKILAPRFLLPVLLLGAATLSYMASIYPFFAWDQPLAGWISDLTLPGLGGLMIAASWSGNYTVAGISYLMTLPLAIRWGGWNAGLLVLAMGALDLSNSVIKALVGRPRPMPLHPGEAGSFPSGHTVHAVLLLGLIWLLFSPRMQGQRQRQALAGLLVTMALLVGASRVYLERHWPSDVLGGYLIGGLALWAFWWAWRSSRLGILRPERGDAGE